MTDFRQTARCSVRRFAGTRDHAQRLKLAEIGSDFKGPGLAAPEKVRNRKAAQGKGTAMDDRQRPAKTKGTDDGQASRKENFAFYPNASAAFRVPDKRRAFTLLQVSDATDRQPEGAMIRCDTR